MRNLHFWVAAVVGLLIAAFAIAVLRIALAESLWLDELHTSWTVSGAWHEIASRAAAGNQTPLYFWLTGLLSMTLGQQSDWLLRLPSVVAWLLAIVLVAWRIRWKTPGEDAQGWLFALCVVSWIVLDRLQWFYATEARPYALVQLVSLAGWCCVEGIVQADGRPNRTRTFILAWCLLSVVNVYLHLTAVLPILLQWLVCGGLVLRTRGWQLRREQAVVTSGQTKPELNFALAWPIAAVAVGLALLPILQLAFPVWQRRAQWATFASDISLSKAIWMFPFIPVLVCVFIGCTADRMYSSKGKMPTATDTRWLWWSAMLGPWLLCWTVTAIGVAPVFHSRYVFASALPVFVVGAIELMRCRNGLIRWLTSLAVAVAIMCSQGSVSVWRAGYLVGNLRGEDWRGASRWLSEHMEPGQPLLCSSGLIEANSIAGKPVRLPLDDGFAEYLSFPLLGVYRVVDRSGHEVSVTPLVGDYRHWASQVIERLAEEPAQAPNLWLVYRGALGRLKTKLAQLQVDLHQQDIRIEVTEPKGFGNLYVVELKR